MTGRPDTLVAPENDYGEIAKRKAVWDPSIAVIIPVYNRVRRLDATLAGLLSQSRQPDEVVVADDGSQENVASVVAGYADGLPIRLVRQERDGFGAGQARNLGAAASESQILLFVDSDCIPAPDLLERHLWWHRRAAGLVVVGSRFHLDGDSVTPKTVEGNFSMVLDAVVYIPDDGAPDDWRGLFYRRNRKLRMGDGAFRAVLSSNMSLEAQQFDTVGGFPSGFRSWGGEDTELGWRLWNNGSFIVAANEAAVYHQLEPDEDRTWRQASVQTNRLLMADRVPHRFYRKIPSALYLIPRVSWIVSVETVEEADGAWEELSRSTYPDTELVVTGPADALVRFTLVVDNPRIVAVEGPDVAEAVRAARGELIALLDGRMVPNRGLLERAVRRFDVDPRVSGVRVAYAIKGAGTYRRLGDLSAVDAQNNRGVPLFAVVRRREAMKDINAGGPDWESLFHRCRLDLLINDTVKGQASDLSLPSRSPLPLGVAEVRRAGAEESARTVVRAVRAGRNKSNKLDSSPVVAVDPKPVIRYVGWTGKRNLGDDAMLAATRQLMPWAAIDTDTDNPAALMLGGGTLINSNGDYLRRMERLDSPRLERIVFGTGVRSPSYWDMSEPIDRWWPIFGSSLPVTVRGPDSEQTLREAGYTGRIEVIGDPALSLTRSEGVADVAGRVVICPIHTAGRLWGGDDRKVLASLSKTIARLTAEGREVVLMTAFPSDDRWALSMMRDAGHPDLEYVPGYEDLEDSLRLLASADLVIGERLHAVVLAAAMATPFVAVEYRPKLLDFARSIGREDAVVRTDNMSRLDDVVDDMLNNRSRISSEIQVAVSPLRLRQAETAKRLQEAFGR